MAVRTFRYVYNREVELAGRVVRAGTTLAEIRTEHDLGSEGLLREMHRGRAAFVEVLEKRPAPEPPAPASRPPPEGEPTTKSPKRRRLGQG